MSDAETFVRSRYPLAASILLNKNMFLIMSEGGNKMNKRGEDLSAQFRRESDAWQDAAAKIRQKEQGHE